MGHTYHKVYLQFVFAVKYRNAVLDKNWHKLQTCASKGDMCRAYGSYKFLKIYKLN
jgi:hypothetical protein